MMKRSFRDKWVNDLRSGNYSQFSGELVDECNTNCRCCLGVAYNSFNKIPPLYNTFPEASELMAWGLEDAIASDLANRNDGQVNWTRNKQTFEQIADYIMTLPVEE